MSWARARRSTARTGRPRSAEVQPSRGTAVGVTEIKTDGADDCATREAFFGFDTRLGQLEMEPTVTRRLFLYWPPKAVELLLGVLL